MRVYRAALLDTKALQQQTKRGESYISEMKLVTARILTLQRLIRSKEILTIKPLKDENLKLKCQIAALKLEVETLKQRPVEPASPAAPVKDALLEKMLAEALTIGKKESVPEVMPVVEPVASPATTSPTTTMSGVSGSFPAELHKPAVTLTPPREETINLARPLPVITPGEVKKKAIANSCSQFSDERIQANVERIQRDARRNAPQTRVAAIEQEVEGEKSLQDRYQEALDTVARLRALHRRSEMT